MHLFFSVFLITKSYFIFVCSFSQESELCAVDFLKISLIELSEMLNLLS